MVNTKINTVSLAINSSIVSETLQNFIRSQIIQFQRDGAVIGISGGLDSAVIAALAVRALGNNKVFGLILPERESNPESKKDAVGFVKYLRIKYKVINITKVITDLGAYKFFPLPSFFPYKIKAKLCRRIHDSLRTKFETAPFSKTLLGIKDPNTRRFVAYYRTKHRTRMIHLYFYAELNNYIVIGTGNKSESLTGYFTKYGDSAVDIMPLLPLYKTQVIELARYLDVPANIINKAPSSDLIPGISDEFSLNLSYRELDSILYLLEYNVPIEKISIDLKIGKEIIDYVNKLRIDSSHMRNLPPSPKLDKINA